MATLQAKTVTEKYSKIAALAEQIEMEVMEDEFPDLSWLETEYTYKNGRLHIVDSCQYSNDDIADLGEDVVMGYIKQDRERLESYGRSWHMVGIWAKLTLEIPCGENCTRTHTFTSGGLRGIESDSGDDYFQEVFEAEKQSLLRDLQAMVETLV